ncbi:pyridoxal-phosphate-dependent aminotransferase family protein [Paraburkholderia rhizosphaerae]|uniref:Alanine-glyoxylate transaminase/serine-glyoxylate transaminase/serine-pyruvate transaminase n=1 Tax=Paraburkholderia rhizosphaerae TaxID=480658 RepID=A0A4R8M539_9BURK|nr:aminotransferase class V-fold PLP-dependent enzyme [Paraburkholderia rhizosphaerae]TDY54932.1 alanine-glyoxylate transaminase/serine-glyoxylate transaminase/serine-pyruvate transaminase [Paraburkholderia rhizosphaerae]
MNPNLPTTAGIKLLHTPGPTHVPDLVRNAMSAQPFDLNDPRLTAVVENCERGLQRLLNTKHADVIMYTANGHGAWEAAIVNLLPPGGKVLVAGTGHFSETWAQAAEGCGAHAIRTEARAGSPIDPSLIEAALREDKAHEIIAVFAVQTDTSTGVTSDIRKVRQAMDRAQHPALLVVDVVASLAATPFEMDAWGVNVAIGASQKALMLPPGMSFTAVDEKALNVARDNRTPRVYWDWITRKSPIGYRKFGGTPPESHLMGLEVALRLIESEGYEAVFARHARIARAVHAAVERWSEHGALWLMVKDPSARSTSITAIGVRENIDPAEIYTVARERFHIGLAGGLGPHAGKLFRIGHLGDINEAMILGCLSGVDATLRLLNVPIGNGAIESAIAVLNEHLLPAR